MKKQAMMCAGLLALVSAAHAQEQKIGAPPEASNMRQVGYSDLQARSAYQPTIHQQGNRFIAYIGHHGGTDDEAEWNRDSKVDRNTRGTQEIVDRLPEETVTSQGH